MQRSDKEILIEMLDRNYIRFTVTGNNIQIGNCQLELGARDNLVDIYRINNGDGDE